MLKERSSVSNVNHRNRNDYSEDSRVRFSENRSLSNGRVFCTGRYRVGDVTCVELNRGFSGKSETSVSRP